MVAWDPIIAFIHALGTDPVRLRRRRYSKTRARWQAIDGVESAAVDRFDVAAEASRREQLRRRPTRK